MVQYFNWLYRFQAAGLKFTLQLLGALCQWETRAGSEMLPRWPNRRQRIAALKDFSEKNSIAIRYGQMK